MHDVIGQFVRKCFHDVKYSFSDFDFQQFWLLYLRLNNTNIWFFRFKSKTYAEPLQMGPPRHCHYASRVLITLLKILTSGFSSCPSFWPSRSLLSRFIVEFNYIFPIWSICYFVDWIETNVDNIELCLFIADKYIEVYFQNAYSTKTLFFWTFSIVSCA